MRARVLTAGAVAFATLKARRQMFAANARFLTAIAIFAVLVAACGGHGHRSGSTVETAPARSDPPLLIPWSKIGNIELGKARQEVFRDYAAIGRSFHVQQRYGNRVEGYYRLHGGQVGVIFYGNRVGEIEFNTAYYRTRHGFGVGSHIPLGRCQRTERGACQHWWHGFLYNPRLREGPCSCWVKVGLGARSLAPAGSNFGKPWFLIYVEHGRIVRFHFALRFVD